jgi:hypothetical protein
MKTARIIQVQSNGKSGDWFIYEYKLDDGFSGISYSKSETAYALIGDIVTYETAKDKKGNDKIIIKEKKVGPSVNLEAEKVDVQKKNLDVNNQRLDFDKDKQILIIRQSSIKSAVDFLSQKSGQTWIEILEHADIFTNYVLTGKIPDVTELDKLPF